MLNNVRYGTTVRVPVRHRIRDGWLLGTELIEEGRSRKGRINNHPRILTKWIFFSVRGVQHEFDEWELNTRAQSVPSKSSDRLCVPEKPMKIRDSQRRPRARAGRTQS